MFTQETDIQAHQPKWRLRPRPRKTVTVIHIFTSVALLGEVWVLVALDLYATLAADAQLAYAAYRPMLVLVFAGGIPFSLTALVAGIALAVTSRWGLLRHYWVFAKLLLLIAVICLGMLLFQPAAMAAIIEAGSLSSGRQWQQVSIVATQLRLLVTATTLSVFKPKGRIMWSLRRVADRSEQA